MISPNASAVFFDHFSNQEHESVDMFLSSDHWGEKPWDEMNIPVGLSFYEEDDHSRWADFVVFLPRKAHAKHVRISIHDDADVERLRWTLTDVDKLYDAAKLQLLDFADGRKLDEDEEGNAQVLYYWEKEENKNGQA